MATAVNDLRIDVPAEPWRGDDFAAWLPAMLVKELRQGVQSGGFFWTFLLFQAALFLLFTLQTLLASVWQRGTDAGFTFLFWMTSVVAVAVLVPLRGFGAVSGERRGNALDLLQITRLSTARIVLGKWASLVTQSCLVAATILPYLVLRYYFGDVDVLADLQRLGWVLVAAAVVAAVAIAASTLPIWMRIGLGLVLGWAGLMLFASVMSPAAIIGPGSGFGSWQVAVGLLGTLAVYTAALLAFATARIAPAAENHACRLRLLALAFAAAWPLAGWLGSAPAAIVTFLATGPLLLAVAVGALLEKPSRVRTLSARFRRAGPVGRLAATLLAPGWATGLVFLGIVAAACSAGGLGFVQRFAVNERPVLIAFATLFLAAIIYPLPFTALPKRFRYPLLLYGLVQVLCFVVFLLVAACRKGEPWAHFTPGLWVTTPFPVAAACALVAEGDRRAMLAHSWGFTIAGSAVIGGVLMTMARSWIREIAAGDRLVRGAVGAAHPSPAVAVGRRGRAPAVRSRAAAARPWIWQGDDFPGWLSPMLVRELRQGVRSAIFSWTFIGIQAVMFFGMGADLTAAAELGRAPARSDWFWAAIALAIVVVIPLRGLVSVSGERAGGNLDLVRLTRLSATRIVVGKWAALVGQGLLVAVTMLPHLVLRYFFGSVDVLADLELFAWIVIGSMLVAAVAVAVSTLPLWLRIGVIVVVGIVGFWPAAAIFEELMRGARPPHWSGLHLAGRLGLLAGVALHIVALLEYAAARIAPPAENHAAPMRLVALVAAAAWAVVGPFGEDPAFWGTFWMTAPLLLCYTIGALVARPVPIATIYRPFARWGRAGRLAAAVFTPGWATALPFVAIVAGLCATGWLAYFFTASGLGGPAIELAVAMAALFIAGLVFPLPLIVRLPRVRLPLFLYTLVQVACLLAFVFLAALAARSTMLSNRDAFATWPGWVLAYPFPLTAMCALLATVSPDVIEEKSPAFVLAAVVTTLGVLGLVAGPWLAEMRRVMRLVGGARTDSLAAARGSRHIAGGDHGHEPA